MNLRSVDLNLLVILHALLEERHVTRAARRLALSQPAASNALERCRQLFGDPLLERVPGGMRLTARAENLREPLAAALAAVTHVMAPEPPDLAHLRRTVRLVMADQPGIALLQALLPALREEAPGVDVVLLPWRGATDAVHRLETGEADLAVSLFPALPPTFRRVVAAAQHYVVAMREDHPAATGFDRDAWLAWPHPPHDPCLDLREAGLVRVAGGCDRVRDAAAALNGPVLVKNSPTAVGGRFFTCAQTDAAGISASARMQR